jgi:hypothetical protein
MGLSFVRVRMPKYNFLFWQMQAFTKVVYDGKTLVGLRI